MAREKEEKLKAEPQRDKKVNLSDYLDEQGISNNKKPGVFAFLKLPKKAVADRKYLDSKMKEYNTRRGGGL